jgi:hypothetical protein
MSKVEMINDIERQILAIEMNDRNIIGGAKAFHSGAQTFLKPAAAKKVAALNAKLDKLLDSCEG